MSLHFFVNRIMFTPNKCFFLSPFFLPPFLPLSLVPSTLPFLSLHSSAWVSWRVGGKRGFN